MVDAVEDLIRTELGRLATPVADRKPEWNDVRARVPHARAGCRSRPCVSRWRSLFVVAVVVPAVAFSSGVRSFLGFESPRPQYEQAHLTAAAPLPDGGVAHLWVSPSSTGGDCLFVTFDPQGSTPHPSRMFGGGGCSREPQTQLFNWSLSRGSGRTPTVLSGRIDPRLHPNRVILRWHGGFRDITSPDGYFIAAEPILENPAFRSAPPCDRRLRQERPPGVDLPDSLELPLLELKARAAEAARVPESTWMQHDRCLAGAPSRWRAGSGSARCRSRRGARSAVPSRAACSRPTSSSRSPAGSRRAPRRSSRPRTWPLGARSRPRRCSRCT